MACGAREAAERGRPVGGLLDAVRQDRGVLQALTPALAEVWAHRMRGVANEHDRSARPLPGVVAVVEVVAEHVSRIGGREQRGNRVRPSDAYFDRRYVSSPAGEVRPSGPRSVANQ